MSDHSAFQYVPFIKNASILEREMCHLGKRKETARVNREMCIRPMEVFTFSWQRLDGNLKQMSECHGLPTAGTWFRRLLAPTERRQTC